MTRILLYIEDSQDNVRLVGRILRQRPGITLRSAPTGQDGVRAAIEERPGLILLDNRLPDATGAEVLRQLRNSEQTAAIPVLIVSGDTAAETIEKFREAGAAGFIGKPFDIHDFLSEIDKYLT
ncbi:MAG TPA: response regulator [Streptosporangiaceae bacterium]|nr:response regulator [Streptosporangiaceae bacterium]